MRAIEQQKQLHHQKLRPNPCNFSFSHASHKICVLFFFVGSAPTFLTRFRHICVSLYAFTHAVSRLYKYDVEKLGWSREIESAWRAEKYSIVSFGYFKSTVRCLPDSAALLVMDANPILCHASKSAAGTPDSAFATYVCACEDEQTL